MDYVLVFRPEVRDELNEAFDWYEARQPGLGDDFLDCIDELLNQICRMPELYSIVHRDVRRAVLRRFPYAIYYRIVASRIIVISVFHGRRHPKDWKRRN